MLASNRCPTDTHRANHEAVIRWNCQTAGAAFAGFDGSDLGIHPAALWAGQERRNVRNILRLADTLQRSQICELVDGFQSLLRVLSTKARPLRIETH